MRGNAKGDLGVISGQLTPLTDMVSWQQDTHGKLPSHIAGTGGSGVQLRDAEGYRPPVIKGRRRTRDAGGVLGAAVRAA